MSIENKSICLINPPSPFLANERVFPSLGILRVSSSLTTNKNPVSFLDLSGISNPDEIATEFLNKKPHDFVGITATTPQLPSAIKISKAIKEKGINTTTILGGPHATMSFAAYEHDTKNQTERRGTQVWHQLEEHFTKQVIGDGERAIFKALACGTEPQLIRADNLDSPLFFKKNETHLIPIPDREMIDLDSYHYYIDGERATSLIAQLGCPFGCGFCGGRDSQAFRLVRPRNPKFVIEEVKQIYLQSRKTGTQYKGFMFYDDELNVSPKALEELCEGLISLQKELNTQFVFRGFVRADLFTLEQAILMKAAGFTILLSGFESGSTEILQAMHKGNNPNINTKAVNLAHEAGLKVKALMTIGHPGESEKTVRESIDWVKENLKEGDDIDWAIITQYPGTPYFDHSVQKEDGSWVYTVKIQETKKNLYSCDVDYSQETHAYKGIPGNYTAHVWTDYLSRKDLVNLRDQAEKETREYLNLPPIQVKQSQPLKHPKEEELPSYILRQKNF